MVNNIKTYKMVYPNSNNSNIDKGSTIFKTTIFSYIFYILFMYFISNFDYIYNLYDKIDTAIRIAIPNYTLGSMILPLIITIIGSFVYQYFSKSKLSIKGYLIVFIFNAILLLFMSQLFILLFSWS